MRTCSCALFVRDGLILLGRRSPAKAWLPGVWDLIGGHAAAGETPEEAFLRETEEEIGSLPEAYALLDTLVYRELWEGSRISSIFFWWRAGQGQILISRTMSILSSGGSRRLRRESWSSPTLHIWSYLPG